MKNVQQLNLYPVATVTADGFGSAIDLSLYEGPILVTLDCSAGSGNMTNDVKLTECATSGGSYTDVAGGAFTQVTTTASNQSILLNSDGLLRYVKLDINVGGTTPSFLVSAKIFGIKKYI